MLLLIIVLAVVVFGVCDWCANKHPIVGTTYDGPRNNWFLIALVLIILIVLGLHRSL